MKRGPYVRRAPEESDREYRNTAPCRDHELGSAWIAEPDQTYTIGVMSDVPGERLLDMARQVCSSCPVQWQCAEDGILLGATWGVWGEHAETLAVFRRKRANDWQNVLEMAKSTGTPVQTVVRVVITGIT